MKERQRGATRQTTRLYEMIGSFPFFVCVLNKNSILLSFVIVVKTETTKLSSFKIIFWLVYETSVKSASVY